MPDRSTAMPIFRCGSYFGDINLHRADQVCAGGAGNRSLRRSLSMYFSTSTSIERKSRATVGVTVVATIAATVHLRLTGAPASPGW
jgi:hypothetical protein